jgi:hypothetical protein
VIILDRISLDKEVILNATEEVIRRYGPEKANISDVAKLLKVSHAALIDILMEKMTFGMRLQKDGFQICMLHQLTF